LESDLVRSSERTLRTRSDGRLIGSRYEAREAAREQVVWMPAYTGMTTREEPIVPDL
jgi:hypothetical protein